MKPKTQLQKQVVERAKTLSPLTPSQKRLMIRHSIPHIAKVNAKGVFQCLDCNKTWKGKPMAGKMTYQDNAKVRCPHCGAILYVDTTRKKKHFYRDYALKVERCGSLQVLRMFQVGGVFKVGEEPKAWTIEVFQKWIDPKGKTAIISRLRQPLSIYVDAWVLSKDMDLRNENFAHSVLPQYTLGRMSLIPELKRNGYKGDLHGMSASTLFPLLLSDPKFETLMKAEQWELMRYFAKSDYYLEKFWPSVRIAIRNRYHVKEADLWCDMLNILSRLEKDTRNPLLICPDNVLEAHNKWDKMLKAKQERERARRMRERMQEQEQRYINDKKKAKEDEAAYQEAKKRFFDLEISDHEITIRPLKSVSEFIDEAATLHHCCFSNRYFEREQSLILHAVIGGLPIETIEIDLKSMKIVQCRAKFNGTSDYHDRIVNLMNANLHEVAKRIA